MSTGVEKLRPQHLPALLARTSSACSSSKNQSRNPSLQSSRRALIAGVVALLKVLIADVGRTRQATLVSGITATEAELQSAESSALASSKVLASLHQDCDGIYERGGVIFEEFALKHIASGDFGSMSPTTRCSPCTVQSCRFAYRQW